MIKKVVILFAAILIALIWYAFPILKPLPKPTGKFVVGTTRFVLHDKARREIFSANPNDIRSLLVRVWYPNDSAGSVYRKPYLQKERPYLAHDLAMLTRIPTWLGSIMLANMTTYAYENIPLSSALGTYPVVIFSHGLLGSMGAMYEAIVENIASHGYIVVGIDHPYLSQLVVFPDGKVITVHEVLSKYQKLSSQQQYDFVAQAIEIYKADFAFVLNQLEKINADAHSLFYDRLDLSKIAIAGHSAGGTAAIEFAKVDSRAKAAIDLDGWYEHVISYDPVKVPLLLMFNGKNDVIEEPSDSYLKRKEITREQYFEREKKIIAHKRELCEKSVTCTMVTVPGSSHTDFSDFVLAKWPLRPWNGPDSYKLISTINADIMRFLDQYVER